MKDQSCSPVAGWTASWLAALLAGGQMVIAAVAVQATTVQDLCGNADPCVVDSEVDVEDGSVLDLGGRALNVAADGVLSFGSGELTINAGAVTIELGGLISGRGTPSTSGGILTVNAESINVAGTIDTSGAEGQIRLTATGNIDVSGELKCRSLSRDQNGGAVTLDGAAVAISGEIDGIGGTEDAFGADVEVMATGDITVSGSILMSASNGGTLALDAGIGQGAGNVIVTSAAILDVEGNAQGGLGGAIDITAAGDGISTGSIQLNGTVIATGDSASEEFGGGDGGCLALDAIGDITVGDANTPLTMTGGSPDGSGGTVELTSDNGAIRVEAPIDISAAGIESAGGAIDVDSFGPVILAAAISGQGGDGGEVSAVSAVAGVTVQESVVIDVSARDAGAGGSICLDSALVPTDESASTLVFGDLILDGGGAGGAGGSLDMTGRDATRVTGTISANGGANGGLGGGINVASISGTVFIEGTIEAVGRGAPGGAVGVDAEAIEVSGTIDASGNGANAEATTIGLRAPGTILISGDMSAVGSPGPGGLIEVNADGDVTIAGTLSADGAADPGGRIDVRGANVLLCGFSAMPALCQGATGVVRTTGPSGTNRFTARGEALVFGTMTAELTGRNEIVVRPPGDDNAVIVGTATPDAIVVEDPDLPPLVGCGNGIIEEPETCDDRNTRDGDGCSATCQIENTVLGDVNGDASVDRDDVGFLAEEIYDGDGTLLGDVSRGGFVGTPGADANQDGIISAADIPAIVDLLAEP